MLLCETCNVPLKNKMCYTKHLKSKRHLHRTNICCATFDCVCGKNYSYHQSLYVHRKKCLLFLNSKENTKNIENVNLKVQHLQCEKEEMRQKLDIYEKEHNEMKAQIAMLLDKHAGVTTNNNNNIDNQTNNNITININAFGNENIDYIDDKTILDCIGRVYKSIPTLLEKIHFDPSHPENHNIKITNKKLPYASVMGNNKKWKTVDRKDAIETMVVNGYNILDDRYFDQKDGISGKKQERFKEFQARFQNDDKELHKQLKTDVELMVINQSI